MDLLTRVDKASLKNKIDRLVEESLKARDKELNEKREKLRHLFDLEENYYREETKQKIVEKVEREMLDRRNKILTKMQAREKEAQEFLKQKKIQQYMGSCDEIRPYLRKQLLIDSKACQRAQMEERRKQHQASRETQNIWLEIAQRSNKAQLEKEQMEKRNRKLYDRCTADFLKEQVREKLDDKQKYIEMTEENKRNREAAEKEREMENNEKKELLKKRIKLANDLKEQLLQAEKERLARQANEDAMNKLFQESVRKEIEKEVTDRKSEKETLKHETIQYLNYIEKIKKERELEEAQKEKLIDDCRIKLEQEYVNKCREDFMKQRALHELVYETQRNQIKERHETEKALENKDFKEIAEQRACYNHGVEVTKEKFKRKQCAKEYARALLEQQEFKRLQEKKTKEMQEAELHKILEEQKFCEEQAKKFISSNIDVLPAHPHTKIMHGRDQCTHQDHIKISTVSKPEKPSQR